MPRNVLGKLPFPPVILFDEDRAIALDDLIHIARIRPNGASVCIRYPRGPQKRGGYFFHFVPDSDQEAVFEVYDFEKRLVKQFDAESLVKFINHCTGRKFNEDSFNLCQTELNFLKDEEPNS